MLQKVLDFFAKPGVVVISFFICGFLAGIYFGYNYGFGDAVYQCLNASTTLYEYCSQIKEPLDVINFSEVLI